MRFNGVDDVAREQQLQCAALSDETRKPLRAAIPRDDAEFDFGLSELRMLRRDPNVTCEGQLAPTAERETVHGGHDGLGRRLEASEDFLPAPRQLVHLRL